jgi:thiol:disulfide interchange protein
MRALWCGVLILAAGLSLGADRPATTSRPAGYDPARDPAADLRQAIAEAGRSGRRIVLEVGGEWCVWCHYLENFITDHPDLHREWDESFVTVKVNYSREVPNREFLSDYPEVPGYPHLFVLAGDGSLLHSQATGELEEGRSYSPQAMRRFIETWGPAPAAAADAEPPAAPDPGR